MSGDGRRRVLVTGATGVVGSELMDLLTRDVALAVTGCSSGGDPDRGIVAWDMGRTPAPAALTAAPWDVVVHAAARTRWTQTVDEARDGNIAPAIALGEVVGPDTHLIFLSTSHAIGLDIRPGATEVDEYRNAYEWAKGQAEAHVSAHLSPCTIVRFPMVIGRRSDGAVARFSGFYQVLGGIASGLVPAFVGIADAPVDLVPVDDIARFVATRIGDRPTTTEQETIGCGVEAPTTARLMEVTLSALNEWRAGEGLATVECPPMLSPERWERFFYPFARQHLSPLQLRAVELFSVFHPYLSMSSPFAVTVPVEDPLETLRRSLWFWADANKRAASATPTSWTASPKSNATQEAS